MHRQMISLFDTRVCDNNLGNQIIIEPILQTIRELFPQGFLMHLPYLEELGELTLKYHAESEYTFFGGTCALSPKMETGPLWGLTAANYRKVSGVVLVGVGAKHYGEPTQFSRDVYHQVLHPDLLHSVRDGYTETVMRSMGFENVINTGCPSLWGITDGQLAVIPCEKSKNVVMTLTCYHRDPVDAELLRALDRSYSSVFFWPQGPEDIDYVNELSQQTGVEVCFLAPSLEAYDGFLQSGIDCDYVGTRLHGGIRALQHSKRTIIIGLDNRSVEMSADFGFPVVRRSELASLEEMIHERFEVKVHVPHENIRHWKRQFVCRAK